VLVVMAKYTSLPQGAKFATDVVKNNHRYFEDNFRDFYADLYHFVKSELGK
jgi:hypothetical protein